MPDYRTMFDEKECLYAVDLCGREATVTIEAVTAGVLTGTGGLKSKKPMVKFAGKQKRLAINRTNGKTIATMYGKNTEDWIGKTIIIYPTTTTFGGEVVDCIRVKPIMIAATGTVPAPDLQESLRTEMAKADAK